MLLAPFSGACSPPDIQEISNETVDLMSRTREIHGRVLTIDSHDDISFNFATDEVDPGVSADRQVDLEKMFEGGLDAEFFIVYVGQGERNAATSSPGNAR